jgi:hypothetical protein
METDDDGDSDWSGPLLGIPGTEPLFLAEMTSCKRTLDVSITVWDSLDGFVFDPEGLGGWEYGCAVCVYVWLEIRMNGSGMSLHYPDMRGRILSLSLFVGLEWNYR